MEGAFMKNIFQNLSCLFSAGAVGGLCNGLIVWLFGYLGITAMMNVQIAPPLTSPFIYSKIVWGGIWGFIVILPIFNKHLVAKGFILSLFPSLVQLLVVFPMRDNKEFFGLALGSWVPLLVLFYNFIWGLVAVYWYRFCKD
jgi:hypothetical protein